jgi:hypothetical protein
MVVKDSIYRRSGVGFTRHRGTMGMHRATVPHKDTLWYNGFHRGTYDGMLIRFQNFIDLRQIYPVASWYNAPSSCYDGLC